MGRADSSLPIYQADLPSSPRRCAALDTAPVAGEGRATAIASPAMVGSVLARYRDIADGDEQLTAMLRRAADQADAARGCAKAATAAAPRPAMGALSSPPASRPGPRSCTLRSHAACRPPCPVGLALPCNTRNNFLGAAETVEQERASALAGNSGRCGR